MLANRPGFPFLGNDLYGLLGDLFAVHVLDNPLPQSELAMLANYGPGFVFLLVFFGYKSILH
jgi:hypothetical protein